MAKVSLNKVYVEIRRMRLELKSIEKSLESLMEALTPEKKVSLEGVKELSALKYEAGHGKHIPLGKISEPLRVYSKQKTWGRDAFMDSGKAHLR